MATGISRRTLLKAGALAGAGLAAPWRWLAGAPPAAAFSQSDKLRKFIQPLRNPVLGGIPLAAADTTRQPWWQPGVTHYTIDIGQFTDQLHPDLPNPTRLWGFGQERPNLPGISAGSSPPSAARRSRSRSATTCRRRISSRSTGPSWARSDQDNRADVHLHGGLVPWTSDGGPLRLVGPERPHGPELPQQLGARRPAVPRRTRPSTTTRTTRAPGSSGTTTTRLGTTRLNAYAGHRVGLRDLRRLRAVAGRPTSTCPVPSIRARSTWSSRTRSSSRTTIATVDPTWAVPNSRAGDLWYAHVYDPDRWDLGPTPAGPPPDPSCVPEFFADTMLVNGTVYPYLEVEPRQYRFRLLNACQARFLNPRLVYANRPGQHRTWHVQQVRRSSSSEPKAGSCQHRCT